jgi:hypothetical protein
VRRTVGQKYATTIRCVLIIGDDHQVLTPFVVKVAFAESAQPVDHRDISHTTDSACAFGVEGAANNDVLPYLGF